MCSFTAEGFQLALAYLVDIFEALNLLNRHLQGKNTSRIDHYDAIRAFVEKLGLWFQRVQNGNYASFSNLDPALAKNKVDLDGKLKSAILKPIYNV